MSLDPRQPFATQKTLIDNIKSARLHDRPPRLVLNGVGMLKRPEIAAAEFAKTVEIGRVRSRVTFRHRREAVLDTAANNGQMIA